MEERIKTGTGQMGAVPQFEISSHGMPKTGKRGPYKKKTRVS
jgi:hypothetical protein